MLDHQFSGEFKNIKIKKFRKEFEPQEILLDSLAKKRAAELGISEKKIETPLSSGILKTFFAVFCLTLIFLFGRVFQLQVLEGKEFSLRAQENRFRIYPIVAERGVIYDSSLKQLVFNQPSFDLFADKRDLPREAEKKNSALKEIADIVGQTSKNLEMKIDAEKGPIILISENLDQKTLLLLETSPLLSGKEQESGFKIERNIVRDYVGGQSLSHLIGYLGKINAGELDLLKDYSPLDYIGKIGLEKSYEAVLRGEPGRVQIEKNALGREINSPQVYDSKPGKSLLLNLDLGLQKKLAQDLEREIKAVSSIGGAAVAMDPQTGGVLAAVSIPDFNNNLFSKGSDSAALKNLLVDPKNSLFNKAISGNFAVGSTIKPLIASAALEEKIISPEKLIYSPGFIEVPNKYDPEKPYIYKDWKVHGWVDMRGAIAESVNVYFYTVGGGYGDQPGLGPTRIKKYLELFGWGDKTGIDLPGEGQGLVPSPAWKKEIKKEDWWDGDTYAISIGQGDVLTTPLQVAAAFSAIANGGILYKPQVVNGLIDNTQNPPKLIEEFKPEIIRQNFIDSKNLQIVREGMRDGVLYGSSAILNNLPVSAASKTGTAQTGRENRYNNWVTVFAPYDNPKIVLTIVIENVEGVRAAALPAALETLRWYFSRP